MDGWNTTFLLGRPIFRGYVSFRECIDLFAKKKHESWLQHRSSNHHTNINKHDSSGKEVKDQNKNYVAFRDCGFLLEVHFGVKRTVFILVFLKVKRKTIKEIQYFFTLSEVKKTKNHGISKQVVWRSKRTVRHTHPNPSFLEGPS